MNKTLSIALCLLATTAAWSQNHYMQVQQYAKDKELSFPIFSCKTDSITAAKINATLQLGELSLLKGHEKSSLFEEAGKNVGFYGSKVDLSYTVYANNDRVLSLMLDEAASGMTMHYWQNYYCFNAKNGDRIILTDIFTPAGLKTFTQMVVKRRRHAFVRDSIAREVLADAYQNNQSCFTEVNHEWFGIHGDTLFVDGFDCLPKGYQANAPTLYQAFSFKQLQPLLNDYGIALFTEGADVSNYRTFHHPQIMKGMINDKYPIYFLVRDGGDYSVGMYAYEKTGIGIELHGSLRNGHLELTETNNGNGAVINARVKGDEITGTWTDKKQNKTYTFHVEKW